MQIIDIKWDMQCLGHVSALVLSSYVRMLQKGESEVFLLPQSFSYFKMSFASGLLRIGGVWSKRDATQLGVL